MTRLLAHAISRRATGQPDTGLRGLPLRWIGQGDPVTPVERADPVAPVEPVELGIWVTEWSGSQALTRADAFAHHDLVAALCEATACVPVRFGTWLISDEVARRALAEGEERFAAAVTRLSDRQEVAVTLLWRSPELLPEASDAAAAADLAPPGRAFLDRKRAAHAITEGRRRAAQGLADRLAVELAADRADVRRETCPSAEVALSLSLLARKADAGALKERAAMAVADLPDVRGIVSGPWPPYSFTEDLSGAAPGPSGTAHGA